MKRQYPSGANKRSKREETKQKNATHPKLTSFFNVSTTPVDSTNVNVELVFKDSGELPVWDELSAISDGADELMDDKPTNSEDIDDEVVSSPASSDHRGSDVVLGDDPVLWPTVVNERERFRVHPKRRSAIHKSQLLHINEERGQNQQVLASLQQVQGFFHVVLVPKIHS